ncbi:hypothetical protein CNR27_08335 [Luteimonas chenhongjianii]|uniref:Lipoprotein n=2 Tax=Luteimonas chenhongjianii TaxID=2006110 RepID=A0A290XE52_9GAMM|nr:hypothetical protein CNR27_08335 [Luteimonas chenhongjianii]
MHAPCSTRRARTAPGLRTTSASSSWRSRLRVDPPLGSPGACSAAMPPTTRTPMSRALLRLAALPLSMCMTLAACQSTPPPASGDAPMPESDARVRIQGEAVYFEKILMPEGSSLRVQLLDNRLAGTPQAVLAEEVTTVGAGPYEFAIDVPRMRLREDGQYALQASVSMPDGSLRFATASPVPVVIGADAMDMHLGRVRLHHVQP